MAGAGLWGLITAAHFVMGTMAGFVAQSHSGATLNAGGAALVGALIASNIAFTGVVFAVLWQTDLRRSVPRVYIPLMVVLTLMAWIDPALWVAAAALVYLALLMIVRGAFDRELLAGTPDPGLCSACGYDLEGLDPDRTSVCPECGTGLPRSIKRRKAMHYQTFSNS